MKRWQSLTILLSLALVIAPVSLTAARLGVLKSIMSHLKFKVFRKKSI